MTTCIGNVTEKLHKQCIGCIQFSNLRSIESVFVKFTVYWWKINDGKLIDVDESLMGAYEFHLGRILSARDSFELMQMCTRKNPPILPFTTNSRLLILT